MTRRARILQRLTCLLPLLALFLALPAHAQSPLIVELTLNDTVQPISAAYLQRGLDDAAARHAALVLLTMNTPGGLLDSTRTMVDAIERSPVPVAVFVAPTGARAGSAGFFLLEAADIAAMAPGTNAGASHPILEGQTMDPVLRDKLANDAAAFLRSITVRRGRNVEAAETAVRGSKAFSDTEALNQRLIDLIAPNRQALFAALNGRTIHRFDGAALTLQLTGATLLPDPPNIRERLLTQLTDPNIAVLLLIVGLLLIYLEFHLPGVIVPGALGALMVLLALFGLNLLPLRHAAVALLIASLILFILEFKLTGHGLLAFVAVGALIFGLATLVDGPIPEMRVHPLLAVALGLGFGCISFLLAWTALRARRGKRLLGPEAMLGKLAIARTDLTPSGQVEIRGELWHATLRDPSLSVPTGRAVLVRQSTGLHLFVDPAADPSAPSVIAPE